ncbi:dephospho-CoA kinase [Arenibacter aquaticus]|uniref:Dephospho-CoA kinase n=1 Tax=Arenibacter aquaticus TaxID=2489054 RepID=A0A3S0AXD2_9FLAO|nr:dephospho-CoA kinase [Arenibacter aquaticus]RTE52523.1 dephospho-CoA kinase [Arenibacter aquaticus]
MMIVGLTGGIGSGKSTVANMFRELGVPVYNSDVEAKNLMNSSANIKKEIQGLLGEQSYLDGKLNRDYVAKKVFGNKGLLKALNGIVHPAVREHFLGWSKGQKAQYVIQEAAIIFENGNREFYDKIILVTAPIPTRISRVMHRDGSTEAQVEQRIKNQLPDSQKEKYSDFIIANIELEKTRHEVMRIHQELLKLGA